MEVDGGRRDPIFSRMLKKIFRLSEKQVEYEQVMPEDINVTFNDVKGVSFVMIDNFYDSTVSQQIRL